MRVFGTGQISEAKAMEAAKKAEEAKQAAQARAATSASLLAEARQALKQEPDVTLVEAAQKSPSALKLAYAVQTNDPAKLAAAAAGQAPTEVLEAVAKQPGQFTDTALTAAKLGVGGLVGSAAFQMTRNALSAKRNVKEIRDLTAKIVAAQKKGESLAGATAEGLTKTAKAQQAIRKAQPLTKMAKLNSGLSVLSGLNSALNLRHSVAALKDGATTHELTDVASDAFGALRGADEATKLIKGSSIGFLAGKVNPLVSIAASGASAIGEVDHLVSDWDTMSGKDKVSSFISLSGDVTDVVGSGLIATGIGAPVGVALKAVGAGLSLVGLGIDNSEGIKKAATTVAHVAGDVGHDVAEGAKKVFHSLNPFD